MLLLSFTFYIIVAIFKKNFRKYILELSPTIDENGGLNWKITFAYLLAWITTALIIFKGVKVIGKVATLTATIPYIIILILFVRSVTLDGAIIGLNFYILEPDFNTIWDFSVCLIFQIFFNKKCIFSHGELRQHMYHIVYQSVLVEL